MEPIGVVDEQTWTAMLNAGDNFFASVVEPLQAQIAEKDALILSLSEKLWMVSQHLGMLAERKDTRKAD